VKPRLLVALALLCAAFLVPGCRSLKGERPASLASASASPDLASYPLRRVGLPPLLGSVLELQQGAELQESLQLELAAVAPFELVRLGAADVAEVRASEPHRRGWYEPRTVLELARRYQLDALLVATVTQLSTYPPQTLALQVELVACETGLPIWSAQIALDASDPRVRASLEAYERRHRTTGGETSPQLTLLSPSRFARFAANELARVF
jgi:hypothetical protein